MIVEENVAYLQAFYPELLSLTIADARAGAHMIAVKLSDGSLGVASSETDPQVHCRKEDRDFGDFTPLQILGRTLEALFTTAKTSALISSL